MSTFEAKTTQSSPRVRQAGTIRTAIFPRLAMNTRETLTRQARL